MKLFDIVLLILCGAMTTTANLLLKYSANVLDVSSVQKFCSSLLNSKSFFFGLTIYGLTMLVWVIILRRIPLNLAYPILIGTTFLTLATVSSILGNEFFSLYKVVGYFMILCGIIILCWK